MVFENDHLSNLLGLAVICIVGQKQLHYLLATLIFRCAVGVCALPAGQSLVAQMP